MGDDSRDHLDRADEEVARWALADRRLKERTDALLRNVKDLVALHRENDRRFAELQAVNRRLRDLENRQPR